MVASKHRLRPNPDVVDTQLDGQETVLLHLESKLYYSLNLTGTRIWQGLKGGLTLGEISLQLQKEFAVEAEIADRSVLRLTNELHQQKLVESTQE
jgi:hypothetical protein